MQKYTNISKWTLVTFAKPKHYPLFSFKKDRPYFSAQLSLKSEKI